MPSYVVKRGYLLYRIYIMFGSNKEHSSSSRLMQGIPTTR